MPFVAGVAAALVFLVFITAVIFRGVVTSHTVTRQTIYGAIAGHVLLGMTWALAYGLLEKLAPGSFPSVVKDGLVTEPNFLFLSFITLTSVGYGDIVPLGEFARSLAILEAIAGVMFQAIFMARLVGLYAPGAGKAT